MDIKILELLDGADQAEGLTVIIDVFRAFSVEAYLFDRGARSILAVGKEETARIIKMHHDEYVLIGERGGKILPGFDYGNSPFQTKNVDFTGKTIIHTTSAGTQGIIHARNATEIITGSLVNASAIAAYIKKRNPQKVSLVAMGLSGKKSAPEDVICARYIRSLLLQEPYDLDAEIMELKQDATVKKFFDPDLQEIFPKEDYDLCTQYDLFPFVLKVNQEKPDVFRVERFDVEACCHHAP